MSSDTSVVTVLRVEGRELDLRIRTETAGGLNDYSLTRSFALLLVQEAWLRARDVYGYGFKSGETRPIEQEAESWPGDWYGSQDFFKENVGRYVEETEVLGRINLLNESDPAIYERLDEARTAAKGLDPTLEEDRLCEAFHVVFLRVRMTDPKWLEGLEPGLVFGSTAYDVWWDDPKRPAAPEVETPPPAAVSRSAGGLAPPKAQPAQAMAQPAQPMAQTLQPAQDQNQKLLCGILGIFLGGFGVHRFILGDVTGGAIRIAITIFTCGIGSLIGLVEGIIYLTKSDEEFHRLYVVEKKAWF